MSVEEKYKKKNFEAQQRLIKEINQVKEGLSLRNGVQLSSILKELEKMMDNKGLVLYYPRMIVDTWDFNDELGSELLELAEIYKRLK